MGWLNYHHLFHFHSVAREGSIAAASRRLHVAHSTLSVQIRELGDALGGPLFERRGRKLVLTPRGDAALGYADDIFRLGNELLELADGPTATRAKLVVGVVPALPSSLAYRLYSPALATDAQLVVRARSYPVLIEELAAGRMHVVLADGPPEGASARASIRADLLGRSGLAFYATAPLARTLRGAFPQSLDDAPILLPAHGIGLRRLVDRWLSTHGVRPRVVAEVEDAATMRTLGGRGQGLFPVRLALRTEVEDTLGARLVGVLEGVQESYFAMTVDRRVRHPLVAAILAPATTGRVLE